MGDHLLILVAMLFVLVGDFIFIFLKIGHPQRATVKFNLSSLVQFK
jgi:hypothetical protein